MLRRMKRTVLSLLLCAPIAAAQGMPAGHSHHGRMMPAHVQAPSTVSAQLTGAFVAAQPPTVKDSALFVDIKNTGHQSFTITGASANDATQAMLMDFEKLPSGESSMKMVAQWTVAPGETLKLAPGGKHVMLMGLKQPLKIGEPLTVTLNLAGGGTLKVNATVQKF